MSKPVPLQHGHYYHIYNRGNNRENLFLEERYLLHLVTYIHHNPQKHGLIADFRALPYSSYQSLCSNRPTRLRRDEVVAWFGGPAQVETAHQLSSVDHWLTPLLLEDFDS